MKNVVFLLMIGMIIATPAAAERTLIETISERIAADPNNAQLYRHRMMLYTTSGNHAAALADMREICDIERDADIAEKCLADAKDYARRYGLE